LSMIRARLQTRDLLVPEAQKRYAGRQSMKIDAGLPLRKEQGFYELEYDRLGHPYRWVGPKRTFFFDLHLDRTVPLELKIQFGKHPLCTGEGLRCFSDNVEIPLLFKTTDSFLEFTAVLLPREFIGLTRLVFVARKSFVPSLLNESSKDNRRLCLLFLELSASPARGKAGEEYLQAVIASKPAEAPVVAEQKIVTSQRPAATAPATGATTTPDQAKAGGKPAGVHPAKAPAK